MMDGGSRCCSGPTQELQRVGMSYSREISGRRRARPLRGLLAIGVLLLTAATGYAAMFVLFDKWYKGGTLGIL